MRSADAHDHGAPSTDHATQPQQSQQAAAGQTSDNAADATREQYVQSTGHAEETAHAADSIAAAAPATALSAPSPVRVDEERTKACSSCLEDRALASYSSAQLKRKGKRVCQLCVLRKEAAADAQLEAERREARRAAFEAKINAAPKFAPVLCPCSRTATRQAPCPRCSIDCCSVACFTHHPCDVYAEARRSMPTTRIAEEDRLRPEEIQSAWAETAEYLHQMAHQTPDDGCEFVIHECADALRKIDTNIASQMGQASWPAMCDLCSPHITDPWWSPECCRQLGLPSLIHAHLAALSELIYHIGEVADVLMRGCGTAMALRTKYPLGVNGVWVRQAIPIRSACLLPNRLLHKLVTLQIWLLRALDPAWIAKTFTTPVDVSLDEFGVLSLPNQPEGVDRSQLLAYCLHEDPDTAVRTLIPLPGRGRYPFPPESFGDMQQHMGSHVFAMLVVGGLPVRERGLFGVRFVRDDHFKLFAVTGWTGRLEDSFRMAPAHVGCIDTPQLMVRLKEGENYTDPADCAIMEAIREEIDARSRPGYFHLIPALKRLVDPELWPKGPDGALFIPTPQLGLEAELVETALLQSIAEDADEAAAAGASSDHPALLLRAHIEAECAAPIANMIDRQQSRVAWMMEAQAEQLRIHAEAVDRATRRKKIVAADSGATGAAVSSSSSSAAMAPASVASTAASSSSSASVSASSLVPLSASPSLPSSSAAAAESVPAYSWTASKEYASVSALCSAGRVKYAAITGACMRFLRSLQPVRINRKGGSHTVFHFAAGKPVTLVRPHGGDGTVSKHAVTRIYQAMHDAALQQMEAKSQPRSIAAISESDE